DAAARVFVLEANERRVHVHALRQAGGERFLIDRLGRGEQHRLEKAQLLRSLLWLGVVSRFRPGFSRLDRPHYFQARHRCGLLYPWPSPDAATPSSAPPFALG